MAGMLRQVGAVSLSGLRSMGRRRGSTAAAVIGIAGVVAVFVGVLSIREGFERTLSSSALPDAAIVLRSGANTEMMSGLQREETRWVADAPGVARGPDGPLASAELFVVINLPKRDTGTDANVPLRGVESTAFAIRDRFEIVEGRMFRPGRNEVVVGSAAAAEFAHIDLGDSFEVGASRWDVVGIFREGGSVAESEIWTDAGVLQPAFNRGSSFQSVQVRLESPEAFSSFKDALTTDPRLNVKVVRQDEYYAEQSRATSALITGLGSVIAGLMGIGAMFGALNTMYSTVAARTREIATLRALGFGPLPVVTSILLEALLLALAGGAIGGGIAYLAFDGYRAATLNFESFSQVAFAFDVTPALLVQGTAYATAIGLLGGLLPALRAARLPVAIALRES